MTVPGTEVPEAVVSVKLMVLACTGWLNVAVTVGTVARACDAEAGDSPSATREARLQHQL